MKLPTMVDMPLNKETKHPATSMNLGRSAGEQYFDPLQKTME